METQVRTPQQVFMQPQRFIVPLFQRPYVWNMENQWAPLWSDVVRVTERFLKEPNPKTQPHFLGAVVLQQLQNPVGSLQARTIIDGQQRLTTLQILLDALHAELEAAGAKLPALRLEGLVRNGHAYCKRDEDNFKVWPTNRDSAAFNDVMAAPPPIDYLALKHRGERLVEAHQYFAEQARSWLKAQDAESLSNRAEALEYVVRELLQLVVIDLNSDENAQEIFETLNARGAQLTAADLIKNFVFQRLTEDGVDVEAAYEQHWKEFETGFWETEISFGRLRYSRSSIFLNHWLIARTGSEVVARDVFKRFKQYVEDDAGASMTELLQEISRSSAIYRRFVEGVSAHNPIDRLQLFAYRSSTLESEVFKPVVLWLYDPEQEPIPQEQTVRAFTAIESWLVRRMLVRAITNGYNQIAADLVSHLRHGERAQAGDLTQAFFERQTAASRYWPDDKEVSAELRVLQAYQRLRRARLRMLLEAIEDHRRGWTDTAEGLGGERVARGRYHIEHVMPQKWRAHWPTDSVDKEEDRDKVLQRMGNLTLLTSKLNSKVSNSAWPTKRLALLEHDVLKLNVSLLALAQDSWTDASIMARNSQLTQAIIEIWPVPAAHTSGYGGATAQPKRRVGLADLIGAGILTPGTILFARPKAQHDRTAIVLPDGRIDVDGSLFDSPSGAARSISGRNANGWWFFDVGRKGGGLLADLLDEYLESASEEIEDDTAEEGIEAEEDEDDLNEN